MKKSVFSSFPVTAHTDYVQQGGTFVVIKGQQEDGSLYINCALEKGARVIVVERDTKLSQDVLDRIAQCGATIEYTDNARKALAVLSAQAAGNPASKLKILAVGGTKGKTTTTAMLGHLLKVLGKKVGFITTAFISIDTGGAVNDLDEFDCSGTLTTPQPDYLQQFLKLCVDKGVEYVVLEVAVQAHTFHRIEGIQFDGIVFTNIDREHAELYPTMEEYFIAKQEIFAHAKLGAPLLINADNDYCQELLRTFSKAKSFGITPSADYCVTLQQNTRMQQKATVHTADSSYEVTYSGFPGIYNASNLVGAIGLLQELGFDVASLGQQSVEFPPVPGRLDISTLANGALVCIDYAHTAASFEAVLTLLRGWSAHLIVVFGAGGGKDAVKRPLMGEAAARLADEVIITDDNPRFEDPVVIVTDIVAGIPADQKHKVSVEHDRAKAIQKAYAHSRADSIIVLLGKGPDEIQIVKGVRIPFSEKQVLAQVQQQN